MEVNGSVDGVLIFTMITHRLPNTKKRGISKVFFTLHLGAGTLSLPRSEQLLRNDPGLPSSHVSLTDTGDEMEEEGRTPLKHSHCPCTKSQPKTSRARGLSA